MACICLIISYVSIIIMMGWTLILLLKVINSKMKQFERFSSKAIQIQFILFLLAFLGQIAIFSYFITVNYEDTFVANICNVFLNSLLEMIPVSYMLFSHHKTFWADNKIKILTGGGSGSDSQRLSILMNGEHSQEWRQICQSFKRSSLDVNSLLKTTTNRSGQFN